MDTVADKRKHAQTEQRHTFHIVYLKQTIATPITTIGNRQEREPMASPFVIKGFTFMGNAR